MFDIAVTFVTKISMLDFVEILVTSLILLTFCTQTSKSYEKGGGVGGLRLLALCNFNFQIWCEFEIWHADNLL